MNKILALIVFLSPLLSHAGKPSAGETSSAERWRARVQLSQLTEAQLDKVESDLRTNKGPVLPIGKYRLAQYEATVGEHGIVMYTAHDQAVCTDGTISQDNYMLLLYVEGETVKFANASANFACHED